MINARYSNSVRARRLADRRRSGNQIVEFALVFILFFVVVLTITEMGRGMWVYTTIATATRRAGDYCMVRGSRNPGSLTDITSIVETYCHGLDVSNLTISAVWNPDDTPYFDPADVSRNDIAEIRVTYPFHLLTGMVIAGNHIQMTSTTRVVVAN